MIRSLRIGIIVALIGITILGVANWALRRDTVRKEAQLAALSSSNSATQQTAASIDPTSTQPQQQPELVTPLNGFALRLTKKLFGVFVSPSNSPVQHERFTGYHTGVDAEVTAQELDQDISVFSIAPGVVKKVDTISGYGGVVVVDFTLDGQEYTVLYGHLKKTSVAFRAGDTVKLGQKIGILGRDKSAETDGERKHLHISIHKGGDIELAGYVKTQSELNAWVDPRVFLARAVDSRSF